MKENKMSNKTLVDFLPEVFELVQKQLEEDQVRWRDTWKHRPIGDYKGLGDQVHRVMARYTDYFDQYRNAKVPMPWAKVIGEAVICIVRELHPEELEVKDE